MPSRTFAIPSIRLAARTSFSVRAFFLKTLAVMSWRTSTPRLLIVPPFLQVGLYESHISPFGNPLKSQIIGPLV